MFYCGMHKSYPSARISDWKYVGSESLSQAARYIGFRYNKYIILPELPIF
jgi:hypothetical protein